MNCSVYLLTFDQSATNSQEVKPSSPLVSSLGKLRNSELCDKLMVTQAFQQGEWRSIFWRSEPPGSGHHLTALRDTQARAP
jgi:hypothetical protein